MVIGEGVNRSRIFCGNIPEDMKDMEYFEEIGYIFTAQLLISEQLPVYFITGHKEN